jgi:small conductance mechanosensitive channel
MHDGKGWHNLKTVSYIILLVAFFLMICFKASLAAETTNLDEEKTKTNEIQQQVVVEPSAEDKAISNRLSSILKATKWFEHITVRVENGVVFLYGKAKTEKHKEWASNLAMKTEDVVAVVNNIVISVASLGELQRHITEAFQEQWVKFLILLPDIVFSLIVLILFGFAARLSAHYMRKSFNNRGLHPLLSDVISKGAAVLCFLIGLYFVFRILGLSNIAITLLGGTGVLGIILGFAFRDISENILASVLLSVQSPFQNGDLVEIEDFTGYIQKITIRATIMMTLDGQIVQIL